MLKGKVLFNSVFTTANVKESSIIMSGDSQKAFILPEQTVVAVGKNVEEIKVGDTVLINVETMGNKVPIITIKGNDYIALTERNITYVYDESELSSEPQISA